MRHPTKEMKSTRRKHSSEFKARIELEALKGLKTVQEIAAENDLHPVQVTKWKSQMLEGASGVFDNGKSAEAERNGQEVEKARLERKVGQLVVEVDWLQKKCRELGIDP